MKASLQALVLVASGVTAFPSYLSCDRPLVVGHVIMGKEAIEETASATAFEGKECGGTYTPGEELTLTVSGGGTYMLEVAGGTLSISGNKCNSRRYANLGSSTASYAMSTSVDKSLVEAWIGRGTGPTLADMPVAIFSKCSLTAAPASSTPTPAPSPGTSPTPAPTTSPTESKGGGAPLIVLPSVSSSGLELFVSLTIERYLLVLPDNLQQYTSGYNGGLTGPTIRVKPGSTLHVELKNQLERKTNLHTHGLHVHGRVPGDDVFVGTEPGDSFDYTFEIPSDHMGGTFLYHPHYHGSTAIQAGGGAAGLIIVEDAPNQLPSEIATLPEILVVLSHLDMPHLKSMGIEEETECVAEGLSQEECDEPSWSEGPISGTPINFVALNGMFQPTISMLANRWYRWRMAYMTPLGILRPTIAGCETKLLAKDGIYLPIAPRDITIGHMGPGNRADWLVRCPVGTHEFKHQSSRRRLAPNQIPLISLMGIIKVTDEGFTPCDLPTFEVNRPCYLVDLRDSAPNTTLDFKMGPTPYINGAKFESATTYAATIPVGEVIQFDLAGIVLHPFHNHINSFQILEEPADNSLGYYLAGDWHDTVVGPEYSMSVRFQTDTFTGPQVFHCHELTHEDRGMIGLTLISGTEPTVWSGAKGVDASCVRGTSPLRAPKILTEGTCSAVAGPIATHTSTALSSTSLCYETDCSFMISVRESPYVADHMEFTVKHIGEAWLGLGVSADGRMGSEAISIITTWEGALSASHIYRLEGRTKDEIARGWIGLANVVSATREEGVSTMVANVPFSDSCILGELVICRNKPTIIIAARGHSDHLGVHPGQTRITIDSNHLHIQPRALKWDLWLHVISMSLAWLFCAPLALFCARARHLNTFKPFLLRTRFKGGRQYWYLVHRNCLITAVTLTTFAGVLMVARTDIHFAVTHSYFGVVTMCLASVQAADIIYRDDCPRVGPSFVYLSYPTPSLPRAQMIDAWLRPKHGHKWRKVWERLHKTLGISVLVLAVISGALGASALQTRVNREFLLTSKIDGQLLQPSHSEPSKPPPSPKLLPPPASSPVVVPSPVQQSPPVSSPPPSAPPLGIKAAVQEAARRIEELCLEDLTNGPKFIRLAFRDAGTYDAARDLYGPRASMRFEPEASHPSNRGLNEIRKLLEPIKQAFPVLSYADLWQLAAVVSIEMMGGPRVPFRVGRIDASGPEECAPAGMLPGAHDTADELRSAFNRMGFNDGELVALMGAHTVGICRVRNSGFRGPWDLTSLSFDNLYYREVLKSDRWLYDGSQLNAANGDGTMLLETDLRMSTDAAFATWTRLFADDELMWFEMFAGAFQKLGELGHSPSSLASADYTLFSVHTGQLQAAVEQAAQLVQVLVEKHRVGPAFVRLAWQDAGTYNATDGKYGPRASMRFEPEASYPSNRGLERIRSMLEPIKQAVPVISYADLWQLAAVVSIEMMGGPRVPFKVGRIDASGPEECAPAGMLPGAHDTAEELRSAFNRMGLNDRERVALMGAHTLGRCLPQNSGFGGAWTSDPLTFDNQYFKQQFDQQWASTGDIYENGLQDGTVRLNADMHLSTEPQLIRWATAFAGDEALFFSSFASAFQKMSQLGHTSLRDATFSLTPITPAITNAHGDSVCLNRERGSCIVLLSWTVHPEDDSATATVKVAHLVGWVALAVSKEGRMTYPEPSYAIIGSDIGIRKHILQAQDVTSLTRSAPLDAEQSVRDASFERSNGFATLRFRTNLTWFTRYADAGTGASFFVYAHGAPGDTSAALGYHGKANRGNRQVSAFGRRHDSASLLAQEQVQNATTMIAKLVTTRHIGPALVRLAWQDAGTFDARQHKYGPRASMRFDPEASYPSNRGLHDVRTLLEPIKQAASLLSYADLWQLAAVVSIEMMEIGRIDASGPEECAPAGMLPGAHDSAEELRSAFNRMGFNDEELVALAGARTLGRCHFQNSGFDGAWTPDPLSFDNKFYTTILANNISYDDNKWISVHGIMLDADLAFKNDSKFRVYTDRFAASEPIFFEAFAKAFSKLSDLGWTGLVPVSYTIPTRPVAAVGVSDGVTTDVQLGDTMQLSFSLHQDGNVSAIVTMEGSVGWIALGVSESGRMVSPSPSLAVIGSNDGVHMRRLTSQKSSSVAQSFPLDTTHVIQSSSFVRADGKSILHFRTSLSWFEHFAHVSKGAVHFVYAHGTLDRPNEQVGYHGVRRGTTLVPGVGRPPALQQPLPPSPPFVQTKSFSPRPDVLLEWTRTAVAATRVSLRVELHVQWLAFAVSATGKMILPLPSRAVVGTMSHGVYQRTLVAKDMTAISSSAPIDSVQSLTNASLSQVDGATILAFTVDHSFLTQFAEGGSAVNFIFSHGEPDSPSSTFGYHGPRRGAMLIQDFETMSIRAPSSPPPSPWLPLSTAPVELTPQAGVSLVVALKEISSVASIKLVLRRQVPWLSVAVSHSGWMIDPNSSKAVVGDLASSSILEYNLVSQNPSMPTTSVKKAVDNAGLIESSVSFADGLTVLQFDIPVEWLATFASTGDVWLLWAHGSATLPSRFPSYHAGNRGAVLISREDLFGENLSPSLPPPGSNGGGDDASNSNPPPPPPQPPDASSCDCGDEVDWCGEMEAYKVAKCYVSDVSLTPTTFSTNHSVDYDHELLLSSEYRIKWKIHGGHPNGEISILLEARTTGWLGFGLMGDPSADGNGMINSDIYIGAVVDGVPDVLDTWSSSVAAPIQDKQFGHTNDIYDIGGFENAERGMTTIWFTRKLVTNDTWDYNFDPGVSIPIIFAYSRKNVDSFSHYHGPTRGFDQIVFIPLVPPHDFSNLAIAAGVAVAMVLFMLAVDYSKKRMQAAAVRAARLAVLTKQIDDSVEGAGKFMFGMVLLRASDFLKHGKFIPYETLRDANEVKLLDTIAAARKFAIDQSIIFFSHQWLGWDEPDPNRVHYACMKNAVERVIEESTTSLEQTWVWVDYSCMPQLNQTTLGLAVSDLSEVACLATFFVVVAPPTLHQDSGAKCDLISYQARGWCRLEQFSFVCTGKTGSMLVSTGGGEETFAPYISQPAEWKKQALWVLQGEYTCCSRSKNHTVGDMLCDKAKLKPALLRMYMKAICHLPPCPLREQLLERDFEILHADSFDDFIVTLARKKFAQVSTMATKLRRLSFTRDFHSTVSHPFHKHVAASETANDTFSDTSFNLMPFGHPSKTEDLRDVSILHGPLLAETKWRDAESKVQVTSSSLQNLTPQPNSSSDGTDALGTAEEVKNGSISSAPSPWRESSNSASVVDELRAFPSTERSLRKWSSRSKIELKRNSCDSTRSYGTESRSSCNESDSGDTQPRDKSPYAVASTSSREVLRRSLTMAVEDSTLGELGKVDPPSGSATPSIRRIRGTRLMLRMCKPDKAQDTGAGALDSPPSPRYDALSTESPGRIRASCAREPDGISERWLLPTPNASNSRYSMPQFMMTDNLSQESGSMTPPFLDRGARQAAPSRRNVWSSPVWDDDSGPDGDCDVAGDSCLNV